MDYLKCVESFVSTIKFGSFTAAADSLGITPAMVGKHVRELERRTGCKLLHRTTRRQGLTEAGQRFYQYGLQILATVREADGLASHLYENVSGLLRISAPVAWGNHVLTPILSRFLQQYPGVNAEMVLSDRKVSLIEERFQLAVRVGAVNDEGMIAIPLAPYQMILAASPDYLARHGTPETPEELKQHHCISFSQWRSDHSWQLEGPDGKQEVAITPRLMVDSGEAIRQAALAGLGIVQHADIMLQRDIDAGRLCAVLPGYLPPPRPMHLLHLPGRPLLPLVSSFTDYLLRALNHGQE
ncbi:LysR family transcriptional regulator [Kosakonia sacchari]|uniref:LysR family transcriptional regulator n=1 Tax=Kosakonia sacchari TaxID=1158459 RepID=UPI002ACDA78F|nr:LysR family transcriptional regulator [Kosakonia sacchari]MDZ7322694.1 LysR family transcriptional regulator [Kosakonia sacchari]